VNEIGGPDLRNFFEKRERIRSRADIDEVFSKGARFSVKGLRLHVVRRTDEINRAIFIPVRKFGGSVRRNRARRLVSEAYRLLKCRLSAGWDFVFVVYPGSDLFKERQFQVESVLKASGSIARTI
jgi:ribonuclease P protein component